MKIQKVLEVSSPTLQDVISMSGDIYGEKLNQWSDVVCTNVQIEPIKRTWWQKLFGFTQKWSVTYTYSNQEETKNEEINERDHCVGNICNCDNSSLSQCTSDGHCKGIEP